MASNQKREILLMGNPNVGKSVTFNKLTDSDVEIANYTGTTVGYTRTDLELDNHVVDLIDVPGTYSLKHVSEAEEVAVKFLESKPTAVIVVLDATYLERNLKLALEIKRFNIPTVYLLNLHDVAERQGIVIDHEKLEEILGAPVIPAVAIHEVGFDQLKEELIKIIDDEDTYAQKDPEPELTNEEYWAEASSIGAQVLSEREIEQDRMERWGELTIKPWPGIPIAIFVMLASLGLVVGIGKALRALILLPLVDKVYTPLITSIVSKIIPSGLIHNVLVGEYGFLIKGIEWPLALILPYVLLFYIILTFLEDCGYLPRIGVLMDAVLARLGIQGGNMISLMLGYGCAIPAIISTRASTTQKERIIVTTMICFGIPCVSQTGAFISLLGEYSYWLLILLFIMSFVIMYIVAKIASRIIPGETTPMVLEIPNLLVPDRKAYFRKVRIRMKNFLLDAELPMIFGIFLAALILETGVLDKLSVIIKPVVVHWLGLPADSSLILILGIIRKELAVMPLLEMNLNGLQMFVGSTLALLYIPCMSVWAILVEEFGNGFAIIITVLTTVSAIFVAGLVNQLGMMIL